MEKIDIKYIKSALENKGKVKIKYGYFQNTQREEIVKEPIPVLGKIFPFFKRKKKIMVEDKGKDLVVREDFVDRLRMNKSILPDNLQKVLDEIPYNEILPLDKELYGEGLFVTVSKGGHHDILTEDGIVVGRFDMANKGYYSPSKENALLPKEASESMNRHQSCEPLSVEEIVSKYCAKMPDAAKHIPASLFDKFPALEGAIKTELAKEKEVQAVNQTISISK